MPHLHYPTDFTGREALLATIKEKVDADGVHGELVTMLASKGIDLDKDMVACNDAINNHKLFLAAEKRSQKLCQQRNTLMKPIMKHLRGCNQFLKNLFSPNTKSLGDWGTTITNNGKIIYPSGAEKRVSLLLLLKTKHESYTTPLSPLLTYLSENAINLETDANNGAIALLRQASFVAANNIAINYRQIRDKQMAKVLEDTREIGSFLMKLYASTTKALGDYGFEVVDTVEVAKERTIKIAFGGIKLQLKVKTGSTISNTGKTDLNIYKGKLIAGIPFLLKAGTSMIASKGYSIFSVLNLSMSESGDFVLIPE